MVRAVYRAGDSVFDRIRDAILSDGDPRDEEESGPGTPVPAP
ncbi:hypothetical protein [Halorarius halobius]|nr:hypothetical protein [Halorarius halobius]